MTKKRAKTTRARTARTRKDLAPRAGTSRRVRGGKTPVLTRPDAVLKTPAPASPVPIPYPN